jgi:glucose-6-phosphate isomerase, archaeal
MKSVENRPGNTAHGTVVPAAISLDWAQGRMTGAPVAESAKKFGELAKLFHDRAACEAIDPNREIYRVRWWAPVSPGSEGGLFWGVTVLEPGKVGDEYFMTHGHFHANATRAEYYAAVSGRGMLIRMDKERRTWGEAMAPGSLHYIEGVHAHRVANIGSEPLIFWACWGSDAGYNYGTIAEHGFGARLVDRRGEPVLVAAE